MSAKLLFDLRLYCIAVYSPLPSRSISSFLTHKGRHSLDGILMRNDQVAYFPSLCRQRLPESPWKKLETDRVRSQEHRELNRKRFRVAVSEGVVGRGDLFALPLVLHPAQQ